MNNEGYLWRVWLLISPGVALLYAATVATVVSIIVHIHVFNSPLSKQLLKPLVENWPS